MKIPCSVSILTLNSADGLSACLESLKNFEEIIVCDGNSTDRTQDIARAHGARVIKQYDTNEPNTPCAMDKAAVRERAMQASTLPWRFFMDSDDTLSPETINEIRAIVSDKHQKNLLWRMPSRVFIADKEIKQYATYPAYQTRLVHASVGAHFRGPVHERLAFDAQKFSVGTMNSSYDFHWSAERVANYWIYLRTYAQRELQTSHFHNFGNFLYWGIYRRARTILGYVLWRLPSMYVRYGFKNTMPLSIELATVRYHLKLLFGSVGLYFKTRRWVIYFVETLKGKDLNRILSNIAVRDWEAYGRVLDIGGREGKGSYWRYLRHTRWHRPTTVDIDAAANPDVLVDIEKEELPFAPQHFDTALFFNVLEHLQDGEAALTKIASVLRHGGTLIGVVPFLVGVHPDPHDYVRHTDEGLRALIARAGFSHIIIRIVGRGPFAASYYQSEFLWPRALKLFILPLVLGLDWLILWARPGFKHKFPLSYAFMATR